MIEVWDLHAPSLGTMIDKAREFYWGHIEHVDRLLGDADAEYAPSGSDIFHPELWKPAHWKWFLKEHKMGDPNVYK